MVAGVDCLKEIQHVALNFKFANPQTSNLHNAFVGGDGVIYCAAAGLIAGVMICAHDGDLYMVYGRSMDTSGIYNVRCGRTPANWQILERGSAIPTEMMEIINLIYHVEAIVRREARLFAIGKDADGNDLIGENSRGENSSGEY